METIQSFYSLPQSDNSSSTPLLQLYVVGMDALVCCPTEGLGRCRGVEMSSRLARTCLNKGSIGSSVEDVVRKKVNLGRGEIDASSVCKLASVRCHFSYQNTTVAYLIGSPLSSPILEDRRIFAFLPRRPRLFGGPLQWQGSSRGPRRDSGGHLFDVWDFGESL